MRTTMEIRVYYEDTDCGGVVYYATYLRYIERARTEYLRARGVDLVALMDRGIIFVVKGVQVEYKMPGRYNDLLSIETDLRPERATLHFTHIIRRSEDVIARADCKLACIGAAGRPVRIPEDVKKSLIR